jgi:hypothetical protein
LLRSVGVGCARKGDGTMGEIEIRVILEGSRNRLEMYLDGAHIGEYERSADRHVDSKLEEAQRATRLLKDAYRSHGKIAVRWNSSEKTKEIRTYQEGTTDPGRRGTVVGRISRAYWTGRG